MAEIDEIIESIRPYKELKDRVKSQAEVLRSEAKNGLRSYWNVEIMIDDLYNNLHASPERKIFTELAARTTDPEFEKRFRAAHQQVFFGYTADPLTL